MTAEEIAQKRIAWAENDAKRDAGLTEPEDVEAFRDIPYDTDKIPEHLLDVYRPKAGEDTMPILINIHGGGWFYGDKELYRFYCMHMAQLGFVVVNCNYRLLPKFPYPAAIIDVCQVVRWTLENRKNYTKNSNWFMVGDSAGAQLAAQYCILASNPVYRRQLDFPGFNQVPNAVALNCGVYCLSEPVTDSRDLYVQNTVGKQRQLLEHMLQYITQEFPPTYLMASVNDALQFRTEPMKKKLEEVQIPMVYAEYGEGVLSDSHVFHLNLYSENGIRCNQAESDFFRKYGNL